MKIYIPYVVNFEKLLDLYYKLKSKNADFVQFEKVIVLIVNTLTLSRLGNRKRPRCREIEFIGSIGDAYSKNSSNQTFIRGKSE
jgi:hypothetical protein